MSILGGGTLTLEKPLVPGLAIMPIVTSATVQASIDKAYLAWLDLSKLLKAFPERVQLIGDTVVFQGPVTIFPPLGLTRRLIIQSFVGIAAGGLLLLFSTTILLMMKRGREVSLSKKQLIAYFGSICVGAVLGFYAAGRCLPTPGVHFYSYSSFIP